MKYHDQEWGVPLHDDRRLFEMLILEGAQAGLSWITILKKRETFREAFDSFDPSLVAEYDKRKIRQLPQNPGIIRNRLKILGAINNAKRFLEVQKEFGTFDRYIWEHLDPTHKAMLVELLQRATVMPVRLATESMRVAPDVVYVIPPNSELSVIRGRLHLAQPSRPRGMRLPVDVLFCSLAREQGERAIGVVLSGMGSDGTLGLQAIKAQGGLTLAQQPQSAQFDSMPSSAIAAVSADIIAPPSELPQRILRVLAAQRAASQQDATWDDRSPQVLDSILRMLREHSKHDLSLYKASTLKRRVERRMGVHGPRWPRTRNSSARTPRSSSCCSRG